MAVTGSEIQEPVCKDLTVLYELKQFPPESRQVNGTYKHRTRLFLQPE